MAHLHGIAARNLIVGAAVRAVRKMTPVEAAHWGWSERPPVLILSNSVALIPARDMQADDGGVLWSHEPALWPGPSFARVGSGKPRDGGWLQGMKVRDLRPLGRRQLERFGWGGETVSALVMDGGGVLVPCRAEYWRDGPGELLAVDGGNVLLVLPEGPKDWTPR